MRHRYSSQPKSETSTLIVRESLENSRKLKEKNLIEKIVDKEAKAREHVAIKKALKF